jgi:hypothetical protein
MNRYSHRRGDALPIAGDPGPGRSELDRRRGIAPPPPAIVVAQEAWVRIRNVETAEAALAQSEITDADRAAPETIERQA